MSLRKSRRTSLVLGLVALLGVVAIAVPLASNAGAQPTVAPEVSLVVDMADDGSTATVTVVLDPGSEAVAAFDGLITYNPDYATPTACNEVDSFGACNPTTAGVINFAHAAVEGPWTDVADVVEFAFTVDGPSEVGVSVIEMYSDVSESLEATIAGPVTLGEVAPPAGNGGVTGTILAGDAAVFGTQVCVESNQTALSTCTDANSRGAYRIDGLATGSYTLTARHYTSDYGVLTIADVAVVSPNLTQGVDGDLNSGLEAADSAEAPVDAEEPATSGSVGSASISGTVTKSDGSGVPATLVCIEDAAIGRPSCGGTGFDGSYKIDGVLPGNYAVSLTDPGGRYADQDGPSFGLNDGQHRDGINFTVAAG